MNHQDKEFNKFISNLARKAFEVRNDFDKLTPDNQKRVIRFLQEKTSIDVINTLFSWNVHVR